MSEEIKILQMPEQQFGKLLEKIGRSEEDHDLLIEIKAILTGEIKQTLAQRRLCHEEFGVVKTEVIAAHKRIDKVFQIALPGMIVLLLALIATIEVFKP